MSIVTSATPPSRSCCSASSSWLGPGFDDLTMLAAVSPPRPSFTSARFGDTAARACHTRSEKPSEVGRSWPFTSGCMLAASESPSEM
jgi:hypothetical protein